jgi:hypothetical protein
MRESDIEQDIIIPAGGGIELPGNLNVPRSAKGIVVFAHGSGLYISPPIRVRKALVNV